MFIIYISSFIIYISSYEEYSIHLFQNRPLDFLIKPLNEKIVKKKLEYVFEMKGRKYHFLNIITILEL